jgi:hypothetical protein
VPEYASSAIVNSESEDRMPPVRAAWAFIESEFEDAEVANVSGSFIRGGDTLSA